MNQNTINARHIMLFCSFAALIVVPPFFYVSFFLSSMTNGFVVALMVMLVFYHRLPPVIRVQNFSLVAMAIIFLLTVHTLYFIAVEAGNRKIFGLILCFAMLAAAMFFSTAIYRCSGLVLLQIFKLLTLMGLLIGYASFVVDISFLNYGKYHKSIFPFAEPSHYALVFSSFFFVTGIVLRKKQRLLLVMSLLLLGALLPNMTLLVITLIMIAVYYILPLKKERIIAFALAALVGVGVLGSVDSSKLSYFYERLPFVETPNSSSLSRGPNLTALVYMQGWEVLTEEFANTSGLGVGLLNMENTVPGYYAELIRQKTGGGYRNRAEGSFFASKLITEYGMVGVLVLLAYSVLFLKSLIFFYRLERHIDSRHRTEEGRYPLSQIYAHSVIVIFVVEAFVRGVGYYSAGAFLLIVAILLIRRFHLVSRQKRRQPDTGNESLLPTAVSNPGARASDRSPELIDRRR